MTLEATSIPELIGSRLATNPADATAQFEGRAVPYAELWLKGARLGAAINTLGVGPGDSVAILLNRNTDMLAAVYGVLQSGAAYIPIDPFDPESRIEYILNQSGAALLLTSKALDAGVPQSISQSIRKVCVDDETWQRGPNARPIAQPSPSSLAYVIFTSGSTGKPKGVEVTHGAVVNMLLGLEDLLQLKSSDKWLALTRISFDMAVVELFMPIVTGASVVIVSREDAMDPHRLLAHIEKQNLSVLQATPVTWRGLLDSGFCSYPGLKMLCGGESWSRELADRLLAGGGTLWNLYGPTETTVWSTTSPVRADGNAINIGNPLLNTRVYLFDENRQPLIEPGTGEIYIAGDGVARGYRNQPDLTAERFLPDPFHPGARMFRTGDLARLSADGSLNFVGRADNQVKLNGFRIELEEIEHAIRNTGLVENCVVAIKTDLRGQKRLVAYLHSSGTSTHGLRVALYKSLPAYMVPSAFVPMAALPRTENQKIDRKNLPEPDWARLRHPTGETLTHELRPAEAKQAAAHSGHDYAAMTDLWRQVFPDLEIDPQSNFFDIGGQSLEFASLQSLVQAELAVDLTAEDILAAPTPVELAARVRNTELAPNWRRHLITIRAEGDQPPLFLISQSLIFREVAQQLGDRQPVYAIQMDVEDVERLGPSPTFEAIAGFYVDIIRCVQPHGPYRIGGWCMAGWLAFEVARQLEKSIGGVELLVIVDAWAPRYWRELGVTRPLAKGNYYLARALHHLFNLAPDHKMQFIAERLRAWISDSPENNLTDDATPIDKIVEAASQHYLPGQFSGNALILRSSEQPMGVFLPSHMGWKRYFAAPPVVAALPGDHRGIFKGESAALFASIVSKNLSDT